MHNLGTVVRFEILRSLKKKSFWIMAIGFPVLMCAIFGVVFASNQATSEAAKNLEKQQFSMEVTDHSGMVSSDILQAMKATTITDKNQGINDVKTGKVDAYFYYPADVTKDKIEVYGKEAGIFNNGKYDGVAKALLQQSVNATVSQEVATVIKGDVNSTSTYYKDGDLYDGTKEMILPGIFLILFYLLISFFGNQMLVSTTEEKENRVIEMILTTIKAKTLIVGKTLSLIALAIIQGLVIVAPALIIWLLFHDKLNLPFIDLSTLPVNWDRILLGFALFAASFIMFTGFLVTVGAAVPTAKEASQYFGMVMMLIFGPLYAFSLFISAPDSTIVKFLSLFPLTAPIPLMLRNALGNLSYGEGLLGLAIIIVTAAIITTLGVRLFRFGALEYSRKLNFKEILSRK